MLQRDLLLVVVESNHGCLLSVEMKPLCDFVKGHFFLSPMFIFITHGLILLLVTLFFPFFFSFFSGRLEVLKGLKVDTVLGNFAVFEYTQDKVRPFNPFFF